MTLLKVSKKTEWSLNVFTCLDGKCALQFLLLDTQYSVCVCVCVEKGKRRRVDINDKWQLPNDSEIGVGMQKDNEERRGTWQ